MQSERPFRILALSGGGVRGIFQAAVLRDLKNRAGIESFYTKFDLVVGTSTGAIVGLALALGVDPTLIFQNYQELGAKVFARVSFPGLMHWFREGGRFDQAKLRKCLEPVFGDKKLSDARTGVLLTATSLNDYSHRELFHFPKIANADADIFALDAVLSSAAAPTFFPPVRPANQERTYVDGALWASNPALVGVLKAHNELGVSFERIKVLSIGTGIFPRGLETGPFSKARAADPRLLLSVINLFSNAQNGFSDEYAERLVGKDNFLSINIVLARPIELHDAKSALDTLPAEAEKLADEHFPRFREMFLNDIAPMNPPDIRLTKSQLVPEWLIAEAGLTGFYPSRSYYRRFRKEVGSISAYISTARNSLSMVSINLQTGDEYEGIRRIFTEKLQRIPFFQLSISLLDHRDEHLMRVMAPVLNTTADELARRIKGTLGNLVRDRGALSDKNAQGWDIGVHKSLPFGSAIIIDQDQPYGRIQIETKPYKAPLGVSFAFEVAPTTLGGFFDVLRDGYFNLLADGDSIDANGDYHKRTTKSQ